jgi:hypothetical protein
MEKNVYLPGETAKIQCHIQNNSTVHIDNMRFKLYQVIDLRGSTGGHRKIKSNIAVESFPGVLAKSTLQQSQPFALDASSIFSMTPSTQGNFIQCQYFINIECDIPWCPNVHLHLPVQILPPPPATGSPSSTDNFVTPH